MNMEYYILYNIVILAYIQKDVFLLFYYVVGKSFYTEITSWTTYNAN